MEASERKKGEGDKHPCSLSFACFMRVSRNLLSSKFVPRALTSRVSLSLPLIHPRCRQNNGYFWHKWLLPVVKNLSIHINTTTHQDTFGLKDWVWWNNGRQFLFSHLQAPGRGHMKLGAWSVKPLLLHLKILASLNRSFKSFCSGWRSRKGSKILVANDKYDFAVLTRASMLSLMDPPKINLSSVLASAHIENLITTTCLVHEEIKNTINKEKNTSK